MNVLSIDFDIIMAPDLPLYNNLIRVGECPLKIVQERFPILQYVKADLGIYQTLVPRILQITKDLKPQDIRVSFSHEDIKYMFESGIITEKNLCDFSSGEGVRLTPEELVFKLRKGMKKTGFIATLIYALLKGTKAKNTAKKIPVNYDEEKIKIWQMKLERLFN